MCASHISVTASEDRARARGWRTCVPSEPRTGGRVTAPREGWQTPYASFDEEYFELSQEPEPPFLQGVLPIAAYLKRSLAQLTPSIKVCSAVATDKLSDRSIAVEFRCAEKTLGTDYVPTVVIRVARIPQPRVGNVSRRAHPHLRNDRVADHPAQLDRILDPIEKSPPSVRRACLVRSVTSRFFGRDTKEVLENILRLQAELQKNDVELILFS